MEDIDMKKTILVASLMLLLAATPALAQQMMGGQGAQTPQQMMEQQQTQQTAPTGGQYYNQYMNPAMMGNYGYGMNPQMMGGGYGYGMGPGMMGGYGMGPGMMGGYGMGPGMMGGYGGYSTCPNFGHHQGQQFKSKEDYSKFLDDTKVQRKKVHDMMFEFNEVMHSPNPDREKLSKMEKEIYELRNEIFNYKLK
jgi:hypothetical protein